MILHLAYNCKFCGQSVLVDYTDNGLLTEERVAYWLKFVACHRCADYHRSRSDLTAAIYQTAGNWINLKKTDEIPSVVQQKARNKFQSLLMQLCAAVGKFKNMDGIYQNQMVDDILENPDEAGKVIGRILRVKNPFEIIL